MVGDRWAGAEIRRESPLAGDASSRRYVRLRVVGGGAPPSVIGMRLAEATPADAPELPFLEVQRLLESAGLAVPEVYAARDREEGRLLLEDLGDRPLAEVLDAPQTSQAEVESLLGAVAALLADLVTLPRVAGSIAFTRTHDEALIAREMEKFLAYGLVGRDGVASGTDAEARAALSGLAHAVATQPRRLMHRDFHAWNLHVDPTGQLRIIDFQDAMQGPATYDLASFCVDRDSQRFVGPDREALLLEAYRDALERRNTDLYPDPRALARDFQRCVAFRALRVIGRFRELAAEEGKDRYLHYIPAMARRARTALEACGDDALVDVLAARSEDFA